MTISRQQLVQLYLSNLQVNVTAIGYNQVWSDWCDLDYTPGYNKFYFIQDGEGWLKIGDEEFYPQPGQFFLMPQGVQQSYSTTEGTRFTKYWCHFSAKVGQHNLFDLLQTPYYFDSTGNTASLRLFNELVLADSSKLLTAPLLKKSAMLSLIAHYIEHAVPKADNLRSSELSEPLMGVIDYIQENYRRNLTIAELAELIHVHPNYFIRIFKQHFGTSPIQYINQQKIEEAKLLLISTDLPLASICSRVGIADISYLSRLFKTITGSSPTAYRIAHAEN
ncbi:AraC family transcriptional regulator [Paenibacillus sp. MMS20-IR301]|uniref:AraC family transcriptional regulator n=1 Tax=Paenibacillus sp. MMS20-IR301 TaxID=2895946 RepID=UPI0028E52DDD|nr:AraC family transcriptional regulator [Paenibacillus sp. MMS20-IR301]WNS43117.1 AraC family transcriptional regulator [Paenibacillus sp. MMS20-IR301]